VVVTGANADPGGRLVDELFASWAGRRPQRVLCVPNLGQQGFLSLVALAGAVVGNSSSGIIEAPALGVPTVNLGSRQAGRLRAPSVVDCAEERRAIVAALTTALGSTWPPSSPYGSGGASARMRDILVTEPLDGILRKRFFDLRHPAAG
jgi:UDP-N-acetylglucosamine 2-epimerase